MKHQETAQSKTDYLSYVYGLLVLGGGIFGYVKAGIRVSKMSSHTLSLCMYLYVFFLFVK